MIASRYSFPSNFLSSAIILYTGCTVSLYIDVHNLFKEKAIRISSNLLTIRVAARVIPFSRLSCSRSSHIIFSEKRNQR